MQNCQALIKKLPCCWKLFVENKLKKLKTFDSIYFLGKSHFEDDDTENYIEFQTTYRYFKTVSNTNDHILSWKSKGLSGESIKPPSTTNNILNPLLGYVGNKTRVEFKGSCLKQYKTSFDHGKIVNTYIVYEKSLKSNFAIGDRSGKRLYWGENSDIGLWIQTWSNLENMTIRSTYFITLQHTTIFNLVINFLVGRCM